MQPRADVQIYREVDPQVLRILQPSDVLENFAIERNYRPLLGEWSWDEAAALVERERAVLADVVAGAQDARDFEMLLARAVPFDDPWTLGLDLGVAGAVAVLNAALCPTAWSTSGHHDGRRPEYPMITLAADPSRTPTLLAAAAVASCGLETDQRGLLILWARGLDDIGSFARSLLATREVFEKLPRPKIAMLLDGEGHWRQDLDLDDVDEFG